MVDVDQKVNVKEMDTGRSSRSGVEQDGVFQAFVMAKKTFGGDVSNVKRAATHVEGRRQKLKVRR